MVFSKSFISGFLETAMISKDQYLLQDTFELIEATEMLESRET